MTYPKFKHKHVEKALFHPKDFVNYKKWEKISFPNKYIIIYQESVLNYIKRKYKPLKKIRLHSLINIYRYKNLGFIKMTGTGSPNAATILEELIVLGGKEFLNIGTAGGLHHKGIFLCNKALRDEGTSYHYISHGRFTYPDEKLTKKLGKAIEKKGLDYFEGTTWTIDAPYRETKAEVKKYAKKGISTVEMEASALFAVAKYRKVKIASAFVVSDILGKKWKPMFDEFDVKKSVRRLVDAAVECLK